MDNDYELLYLASEDIEKVYEVLLQKYNNLLLLKSLKYSMSNSTLDEFLDEAKQTLYDVIENYKDDTSFITYLNICLDRKLSNYRKNLNRKKRRILSDALSIDDEIIADTLVANHETYHPERILIENEEYEELKEKIINGLTWKEELVFILKEQSYTNKEISKITDNNLRTVYNITKRIQNKVSKLMSI